MKSSCAQKAGKGVAEDGVPQVTDVRGLVGVDAGVLDEAKAGAAEIGVLVAGDAGDERGAVEPDVEVTGAGYLDGGNAGQVGKVGGEGLLKLGRDDAGRFAEALGELEGERQGKLTELDLGGLLHCDARQRDGVGGKKDGLDAGEQGLLECAIHAGSSLADMTCRHAEDKAAWTHAW